MNALERAPELQKYELLERIGLGGMATVYRARDRRLGREVAVKLIHAHLRENPEVAARFVSEARAVARLRHPNIVEVFDISDENEPERYLVVELVRGMTLRTLLTKHRVLPAELAGAIGLEVAGALAHAHAQGIIHRDVKPENVLVDLSSANSGPANPASNPPIAAKVKLTDFGIAKLLDAQGVTSTGQVLGSPAHMAPEQIEGGDVGPRADVFALGVMLYECMVGRLPFDGKNPAQVLRRVLDGTYPPADREQPLVGARWAAILARALERNAADRYESVEAFADAIREELARVGIADARSEIDRFLGDQDGYAAALVPRLVERLVAAGEKARAEKNHGLATAEFNRALAYRPGDPELVRRVSALARRAGLVALGRKAALSVVLFSGVAGAVMILRHRGVPPIRSLVPIAAKPRQSATVAPGPGAAVPAPPQKGPAGPAPPRRIPIIRDPARVPPKKVEPTATRAVVVDVAGPKGGYLKIDGEREDEWFGKTHELVVGPHVFEFVPKESECCLPSPPQTHTVSEGEGADHVLLSVAYREARLHVDRTPPGVLRCRSLFGADLQVPGTLAVPMSRLTVTGHCTYVASDSSGGAAVPVTKDVTLTAGQTTEISLP
ncbi:MAG TPA: protein kinase [Polyangiaceae bacterium]|nr:protein kinase [Polyangiaceae bacterium]